MKAALLLITLAGSALAVDEIKSFKIGNRKGQFLERSTYWFRGTQCVACIRGYANWGKHVIIYREYIDFFYAGKRLATFDPETSQILFVSVPEGVTFQKDFKRFTVYSKDFSYFEQMEIEPSRDSGFQLRIPAAAQLETTRKAFEDKKQNSPQEEQLLRWYSPQQNAPTIEEIQARAEKKSK